MTFAKSDHAGRASYDGEWILDRMQGKGVLTFTNGDKYEGQFLNNLVRWLIRAMISSFSLLWY